MRFNFVYGNHGPSPVHIGDIALYVQKGLKALGHQVDFNQYMQRGVCNIMIESLTEGGARNVVDTVRQGIDLIVIATEFVTGDTFNDFGQKKGTDWYSDAEQWKVRFDAFRRVADASRGVWCMSPESLDSYRPVVPGDKLHMIPTGHVEGFATVEQRPDSEKNIDFLFTGSVTPWRQAVLDRLQEIGAEVVVTTNFTPAFIRDDLVSRAKVSLNIKQNEEWKYPSTMRFCYHLTNGSFLLSERCEFSSALDRYIEFPTGGDFTSACTDALFNRDHAKAARENLERFRAEMPAAPLFARLIDESFGRTA